LTDIPKAAAAASTSARSFADNRGVSRNRRRVVSRSRRRPGRTSSPVGSGQRAADRRPRGQASGQRPETTGPGQWANARGRPALWQMANGRADVAKSSWTKPQAPWSTAVRVLGRGPGQDQPRGQPARPGEHLTSSTCIRSWTNARPALHPGPSRCPWVQVKPVDRSCNENLVHGAGRAEHRDVDRPAEAARSLAPYALTFAPPSRSPPEGRVSERIPMPL
jgi:hypothetical protein